MLEHGRNKKRTLYLNCTAGIAGDMFLAALLEIADGERHLRAELAKLPLTGYEVDIYRDARGGFSGLRLEVKTDETHVHRHLNDIRRILNGSGLSQRVRCETERAFTLLAEAEGRVHGAGAEDVHFHEVGAVDAIIDLTGAMIMLEYMGWPRVIFSPLNVGSGTVTCAHGVLPVPAPAVAELLQGVEIYSRGEPMERVTPTGAALVKTLGGTIKASLPPGIMGKTGVGLGLRDSALPNVLRAMMIEDAGEPLGVAEAYCELCSNIDDMSPQDLSAVMTNLFEAGALDVWFEPIQMKKNRPAVKLCCIGAAAAQETLAAIFLRETTSLGVRVYRGERYVLDRRIDEFETPLGKVRVKSAMSQGKVIRQMPEFDDILRLSKQNEMPVLSVRDILSSLEFVPESGSDTYGGDIYPQEELPAEEHNHGHSHTHGVGGHDDLHGHGHDHKHHQDSGRHCGEDNK